jgi:hypothetical protein
MARMKRSAADIASKEWRWKNPIIYKFSDDLLSGDDSDSDNSMP